MRQKKLLKRLESYYFAFYWTDHWTSYARQLPKERHVVGKYVTRRIERQNLHFRTRLKRLTQRTICFSISEEIHDEVIGEFIFKEHY